MSSEQTFVSVQHLAHRTGLPEAWLKARAKAGDIPAIRVGQRLMFHPETVEQKLLEQAGHANGGDS